MLKEAHMAVAAELKENSLDWRTCYTSVYPSKPKAGCLVIEASSKKVLEGTKARLGKRFKGREAEFKFILLPEGDELPELFMVTGSVADVRKEPAHAAELLTQAICGDEFEPLKIEGDWTLVRLSDGYIGWVRSWNLKPVTKAYVSLFRKKAMHRIGGNVVQAYEAPDFASLPVCDAVAGTPVAAKMCGRRGWREVQFPDGRSGFIRSALLERLPQRSGVSRQKLSSTGLRFLGIPYIWGGATAKGFDCSGLMQAIFRLNGLLIPRDADMQSRFGKLKASRDADALKTGDLLFFGKDSKRITHVAVYLSNSLFLHAYGYVRVGSLDPKNPLFDVKLAREWQITRDPISS